MASQKIIEEESQLWELVGDRWRIPIMVTWEEGHVIITLAKIPLLDRQRNVALATLAPLKNSHGEYVASMEVLKNYAQKSKYGNPEDVLEWQRGHAPALHFEKNPGVDEFLDAYMEKGVVQNRAVLSAIWSSLCAHALDWLLNQQKPLPLIFATIYPLQYRGNWKEIARYKVTTKDRRTHPALDWRMIGMHSDGKCATWTLEIVAEKMFNRYASKLEWQKRLRMAYSVDRYWTAVANTVKRTFKYAERCYAEYLQARQQKTVSYDQNDHRRITWDWRNTKAVNGDKVNRISVPVAAKEESCLPRTVAAPDECLPEMPRVQPETPDVRHAGCDF